MEINNLYFWNFTLAMIHNFAHVINKYNVKNKMSIQFKLKYLP